MGGMIGNEENNKSRHKKGGKEAEKNFIMQIVYVKVIQAR